MRITYEVKNVYGIEGPGVNHRTLGKAIEVARKMKHQTGQNGWIVEDGDGRRWEYSHGAAVRVV